MEEEFNSILTPEQKKRLEKRFFRHRPGGFFRPPGDRPPGPPWPGDKHPSFQNIRQSPRHYD